MKLKIIGLFVLMAALGMPSATFGSTPEIARWWAQPASTSSVSNVRYFPDPLYTDDLTITIKWIANRNLKAHYRYRARIEITSPHETYCANHGEGESYSTPKKGHTASVEFSAGKYHEEEWCNGKVEITIWYEKDPQQEPCKEERLYNEITEEWETTNECPKKYFPSHTIFEGEFRILAKP